MRLIKVIYDDGSNGLVNVNQKRKKRLANMTAQEIMLSGFGMFR